jgi:hypothetical protein
MAGAAWKACTDPNGIRNNRKRGLPLFLLFSFKEERPARGPECLLVSAVVRGKAGAQHHRSALAGCNVKDGPLPERSLVAGETACHQVGAAGSRLELLITLLNRKIPELFPERGELIVIESSGTGIFKVIDQFIRNLCSLLA